MAMSLAQINSVKKTCDLAAGAAPGLGHTQFPEDDPHGAEVAKAKLKQVQADKGGKGQGPLAHKQGAAFNTEGKRNKNEQTSKDANVAFDSHESSSLKNQGVEEIETSGF
jgi:hypothetical protein